MSVATAPHGGSDMWAEWVADPQEAERTEVARVTGVATGALRDHQDTQSLSSQPLDAPEQALSAPAVKSSALTGDQDLGAELDQHFGGALDQQASVDRRRVEPAGGIEWGLRLTSA